MSTLGDELMLQLSRNELASYFSCAPSQINYVLSTRFTPDKGYLIESKRGGGGSIKLIRLEDDKTELLTAICQDMENIEILTESRANAILMRLSRDEIIDGECYRLLRVCISDKALGEDNSAPKLRQRILTEAIKELLKGT